MTRYIVLLFLLFGSFGCRAASDSDSFFLDWKMIDNPTLGRIDIEYRNFESRAVCIAHGAWPTKAGRVDAMGDSMFLSVGKTRFPIEEFQAGFCFGECKTRVPSGASIEVSIGYERFKLPEALRFEKKTLTYPLVGSFCR
ncbi:MAG: hypothetical protein KBA31_02395 [Alphaproteobacteria bacterium]|nr:hypothetical protein [Alphaproteobacteria bacterium]